LPTYKIVNINDFTNEPQWLLASDVAAQLINNNPEFNTYFTLEVIGNNSYPHREVEDAIYAQQHGM